MQLSPSPRSLVGFGLGFLLTSCTLLPLKEQPKSDQSLAAPVESPSASPSPSPTLSPERPDTRVIPIAIEGQMTEMELELFDQQLLPFTTYLPSKDFQDQIDHSDQGTVAQFTFSPQGKKQEAAYVQIFLPARSTSVEEMQELLLSDQGLLATNDWRLVDRTDIVSYPWAVEKLIYQQRLDQQNFLGSIYIGNYRGRSFYALTHYPVEYTEGFEPRSTILLENLQFRDEPS